MAPRRPGIAEEEVQGSGMRGEAAAPSAPVPLLGARVSASVALVQNRCDLAEM